MTDRVNISELKHKLNKGCMNSKVKNETFEALDFFENQIGNPNSKNFIVSMDKEKYKLFLEIEQYIQFKKDRNV